MPAFTRARPESPQSTSSTHGTVPTGLAEVKMVGFPEHLVTGVTRPLTNTELWALYNFEMHARSCAACYSPHSAHRAGTRLCAPGHALAHDVARYITSEADGSRAYSVSPGERGVRVEIPARYDCLRSLLRAMERSRRYPRQRPIVALDSSRVPSADRERRHRGPRESPRRSPEIVDWPEYEVREPAQPVSVALPIRSRTLKRGKHERREHRQETLPVKNTTTAAEPASTQEPSPSSPERKERRLPRDSDRADSGGRTEKEKERTDRRRSAYIVAAGRYDVEVREPSRRSSRRYSMLG